MNEMILETERLVLRNLEQDDFGEVCKLLQDPVVMYAYEGAFSDQEVQAWWIRCSGGTRMTVLPCGRSSRKAVVSLSGNVVSRTKNVTGAGFRKSVICSGKNFGIKDLPRKLPLLVKSMRFKC